MSWIKCKEDKTRRKFPGLFVKRTKTPGFVRWQNAFIYNGFLKASPTRFETLAYLPPFQSL
jgi:hypothetical protein